MANLYFPGCKVKGDFPAASEKLAAYIQSKRVVTPVGCCRVDHDKLTPADTAVVVCNNCANIIAESGDPGQIEFVWEIIDNDPEFPFPDYHGEKMTIQDCWLAVEKRHVQDAIRSLMRKMNIDVVELAENHDPVLRDESGGPLQPQQRQAGPQTLCGGGRPHVPAHSPGGAGSLLPVVLCPVYHGSSGLLLQILPGRLAEGREKGPAHSGTVVP